MFGRKRIKELERSLFVSRTMFSNLFETYGKAELELGQVRTSKDLARTRIVILEHDLAKRDSEIKELKDKLKALNGHADDMPKFANATTTVEFLTRKVIEHEKRNKTITDRCIKLDMRLISIKEELADAKAKIKELETKNKE
jgi:chromosome segregation ATPase